MVPVEAGARINPTKATKWKWEIKTRVKEASSDCFSNVRLRLRHTCIAAIARISTHPTATVVTRTAMLGHRRQAELLPIVVYMWCL